MSNFTLTKLPTPLGKIRVLHLAAPAAFAGGHPLEFGVLLPDGSLIPCATRGQADSTAQALRRWVS
jgi:hypothetical protein